MGFDICSSEAPVEPALADVETIAEDEQRVEAATTQDASAEG
jgi:hypothetical protein